MRVTVAASLALFVSPTATAQGVIRISVDSAGAEGNASSGVRGFHQRPISFSADGRFVAFVSDATNLVSSDTNGVTDIFVRDLVAGSVERVSVDSAGVEADAPSHAPVLSADGRFVAFWSDATNLVAGDGNGAADSFVHDRMTATTERVSVKSDGGAGNGGSYRVVLSSDGQIVAFESDATNLVAGDTNRSTDIFVRDRTAGTTERVSITSSGGQASSGGSFDPAISADGSVIAFSARASNLVSGDTNGHYDVFIRDRSSNLTLRVSVDSSGTQGNGTSWHPAISSDGRVVAFESYASNLVAGDTNGRGDVFVHDLSIGVTERVSVDSSGAEGDESSVEAAISSDGRLVAFASGASNLTTYDSNGTTDVFLHDRQTGSTSLVSIDCAWDSGNGASDSLAIPGDGTLVAFASAASGVSGSARPGQRPP